MSRSAVAGTVSNAESRCREPLLQWPVKWAAASAAEPVQTEPVTAAEWLAQSVRGAVSGAHSSGAAVSGTTAAQCRSRAVPAVSGASSEQAVASSAVGGGAAVSPVQCVVHAALGGAVSGAE